MRTLTFVAAGFVAALLAATVFFLVAEDDPGGSGPSDPTSESDSGDGGLDDLFAGCSDGDLDACDELYFRSPVDSFYEEFGSTCGDRRSETRGSCS